MTMLPILKLLPWFHRTSSTHPIQTSRPPLFCLSTLGGSCVTLWRRSVHYKFVSHVCPTRALTGTLNADFVGGGEKRDAYAWFVSLLFILYGAFSFAAKKTMQNSQSLSVRMGAFSCSTFAICVNVLISSLRRIVTFTTGCLRPCPVIIAVSCYGVGPGYR